MYFKETNTNHKNTCFHSKFFLYFSDFRRQ
nr:MAG TPA: hypothetical protein [Caudoviricetes sp.]